MTPTDPCLLRALRGATRLVVLTGAGVSAESGIATFRGKQSGLWEQFDAAALATPQAFDRDPALVWGWYEWRRMAVLNARPNPAHYAIATLATLAPHFTLITQNVDDLHERAGSPGVLHLHGEISRPYCETCRRPHLFAADTPPLQSGGRRIDPPRCESCGARIRPGVVWFGEPLPENVWAAAREAAEQSDVFIVCGTSSVVQPAASLTGISSAAGATTIQVNPNTTDVDGSVSFNVRGPAGEVLPQLVKAAWNTPD
jgi:NAD-dependent protein deacetylase/lipoamidase